MLYPKQMTRGQWPNNLQWNDMRQSSTFTKLSVAHMKSYVLWHELEPPTRSCLFNPKLNSDLLISVAFLCSVTVFLWPHSPLPSLAMLAFFFFLENDITEFRSSSSFMPCYCNPIFCVIWWCQQMVVWGGSLTPNSQLSGRPDRPPLSLSHHSRMAPLRLIVSLFNPLSFGVFLLKCV